MTRSESGGVYAARSRGRLAALLAGLALWAGGCDSAGDADKADLQVGDGAPDVSAEVPDEGQVTDLGVDASAARDAAADVAGERAEVVVRVTAAEGGVIRSADGSATLTIPPGAVAADTEITLTQSPAVDATAAAIYDFGPDGLQFMVPAILEIEALAQPGEGQQIVLAVEENGAFVEVPGSVSAGESVLGTIEHFTRYSLTLVAGEILLAGHCANTATGFVPCGGDPLGDWNVGEVCFPDSPLGLDPFRGRCPEAQVGLDLAFNGALSVDAMDLTRSWDVRRVAGRGQFPRRCFPGGFRCPLLSGYSVAGVTATGCVDDDPALPTSCVCEVAANVGPQPAVTQAYRLDGGEIVLLDGQQNETGRIPYCVAGNTLTIQLDDPTDPLPPLTLVLDRSADCQVDADCMPAGQICDLGRCRPPARECLIEDDCPAGRTCIEGACVAPVACVPDCAANEHCVNGACEPVGCIPACMGNERCVNGACQAAVGCMVNADCAEGVRCVDEVCRQVGPPPGRCNRDADCVAPSVCDGLVHLCAAARPDACRADADCPAGAVCLPDVCIVRPPAAPDCWDDSQCGPAEHCFWSTGGFLAEGTGLRGSCRQEVLCEWGDLVFNHSVAHRGLLEPENHARPVMARVGGYGTTQGSCAVGEGGEWFLFLNQPADGVVCVDTFGSAFDTVLYARRERCAGEVACNDDTNGQQSQLQLDLSAGPLFLIIDSKAPVDANGVNFVLNYRLGPCR